jgi:hypothetical protein
LYEDYEKAGFYVANREKDKGTALHFVYGMAYYSVITASLGYTVGYFISCAAAVFFLLGV